MKKIFVFFCVIFSIISCKDKENFDVITISVPKTVSSIPVAELEGKVIQGKRIEIEWFMDHVLSMGNFVSGKTDILMTGFNPGVKSVSVNDDIFYVATPVWGVSSLISKNYESIDELKGKGVSVPFERSPLDIQLRAIIDNHFEGVILESDDVLNIEYSPIQQSIAMLNSDKIDAVAVPEPLASKLVIGGKLNRVFSFAEKWGEVTGGETRSPQVSLFASGKICSIDSLVQNILKEIDNNIKIIHDKDSLIIEKYSAFFELPEPVLLKSLDYTLYGIYDFEYEKEVIKKYIDNSEMDLQIDLDSEIFYFNNL